MGGKNPQVILDDAGLAQAVELSVQSCFYSTGQRCTASSRLIVTDKIYPAFVDAMQARMARIQVGDACAQGTDIGPVVSAAQLEQDLSHVEIGRAEGATPLAVANDRPFGLSAGVDYHVPFGGRKGSSYGPREQGRYAQEFYTTVRTAYTLA